jgi:hypothetical protein
LDTDHTEKTDNNREYTEEFRAVRENRVPKKAYPELTLKNENPTNNAITALKKFRKRLPLTHPET